MLLAVTLCKAQSTIDVEFTYDEAGNRTSRGVIVLTTETSNVNSDTLSAKHTKSGDTASMYYQDWMQTIEMRIYPNPTQGWVNIEMNGIDAIQESHLTIFDSFGRRLHEANSRGSKIIIDLSAYPKGNYIVMLSVGEEHRTWRIVKQ